MSEYNTPVPIIHTNRAAELEGQMANAGDNRIYGMYDSGAARFGITFAPLLLYAFPQLRSLQHMTAKLTKSIGHPPTGLEIAGQGKAFNDLGFTAGLAACLSAPNFLVRSPRDPNKLQRKDTTTPIALVEGDVSQSETWEKIVARMRRERMEKPNLILITPGHLGLPFMPKRDEFVAQVLQKAHALADPQHHAILGEAQLISAPAIMNFLQEQRQRGKSGALMNSSDSGSIIFCLFKEGQ